MHNIPNGLRVATVARRSKKEMKDSLSRQADLIESLVKAHQMKVVHEVALDDHSATEGKQWEALYEIIELNRTSRGVDAIVASEYSRLARTMDEAEQFYLDCAKRNILLITQKEGLLSGRDAWVMRNAAASANERYAEAISVGINSGRMALMKRGTIPHTTTLIFGIDRLYFSASDEPLFRLRRLQSGIIQKIHPTKLNHVLETYEGPTRSLYPRRQKSEQVILVPGEPKQVKAVRRLFELRYNDGLSNAAVWTQLAREMVPAPNDDKWRFTTVKSVLHNEVYTGVGVNGKLGFGVHSLSHKNGPVIFNTPRRPGEDELGRRRKKITGIRRPMSDFLITRCEGMIDFLPKALRRKAKAGNHLRRRNVQGDCFDQRGVGDGKYFLTGLITNTLTNTGMWGNSTPQTIAGGVVKRYRFYRSQ